MVKVLEQIDGNWVERDSPAVFCREATMAGSGCGSPCRATKRFCFSSWWRACYLLFSFFMFFIRRGAKVKRVVIRAPRYRGRRLRIF